jgi:hypothetical protein
VQVLQSTKDRTEADLILEDSPNDPTRCMVCANVIHIMVFRGTGVCSEQHDKLWKAYLKKSSDG